MQNKIAVVVPSYKVTKHILEVLKLIGPEVARIYVVDDKCPDNSGKFVEVNSKDKRITVLYNEINMGVGGATMRGYQAALDDKMSIIVKLDGDGQMDPRLIPSLVNPIIKGHADYTKGNRFFSYELIGNMPALRLIGNGVLSFFIKVSTGYWNIFDPNNGYTAIHRTALQLLPFEKISNGYFFESDLLFRLNGIRAVVVDVPMKAFYGDEESNLQTHKIMLPFLAGHCRNFFKRILYNYFLRDVSIASFELIFGLVLLLFGVLYGGINWIQYVSMNSYAPGGVVMLSGLTVIVGVQLILSAINYDIQNIPKWPIQNYQDDEYSR